MRSSSQPLAVVADDEETGRILLAQAAIAAGFLPLEFDNGHDALEAALRPEVAIVLLDVEMPGMNGFEVCQAIRAARRTSLPVVMVTGRDDKAGINRAFDAGATDFITKPVNWSLLPHRLTYILRNADREAKVTTLLEAIPDALWVFSPEGEVRWSQTKTVDGNTSGSSDFDEASEVKVAVAPDRMAELLNAVTQTSSDGCPRKLLLREGAPNCVYRSAELRLTRCQGGDVLVVRQDTSERTAAAERIQRLAFYDTLTGLPNRPHCSEMAAQYLAQAGLNGLEVAFLYIDLNGFKRINDTLGHSSGDIFLKRVSDVISATIGALERPGLDVFLGRLGGDEFVILARHDAARAVAMELATAICTALETPIAHEKLEFIAAASVGVAVFPKDGKDVETLLKHADTAMYQAKASRGPHVVAYAPVMSARLRDSLDLETRLRRALREDALAVRYQPKFRLTDRRIVGAEALIRWFDPELGEVSPGRFVPVAEESGLIVDIGAWVIRHVAKQIAQWHTAGIAIPIAINVSGKELLFADPARVIEEASSLNRIPASLLEAEITESVYVTDATAGRSSVERIRALGCKVALDDFGTGYSSLSYLTKFPPDRVKIDRSFIQKVDQSGSDAAIVKAIMSLASTLGLLVTAEGLERESQLRWLQTQSCDEGQGYLLAMPLSAAELEHRFLIPFDSDNIGGSTSRSSAA